jgi:hypothetical protein
MQEASSPEQARQQVDMQMAEALLPQLALRRCCHNLHRNAPGDQGGLHICCRNLRRPWRVTITLPEGFVKRNSATLPVTLLPLFPLFL